MTAALIATVLILSQTGTTAGSQTKTALPTPAPGLEILWQQPLPVPVEGRLAPNLAVGDSFVFLASPEAGLTAHAPEDGRTVWSSPLVPALGPATAGSHVAVVANGALLVLNQDSGETEWRSTLEPAATAIFAFGDRLAVVAGGELRTWEATGAPAWRTRLGGAPVTPIVVRNGLLFVGLDEPSLVAIETGTGAVRWRVPLPAKPESLAATDDRLYLGAADGALYSYRTSGQGRPWRFRAVRAIGQPVVDDGQVYFALLDNSVRAFERKGGAQRWSRVVASRPATGPLQVGTSLAIALTTGHVVELATSDGQIRAPESPAELPDVGLQAAAVSRDGQRLYTVTTAKDYSRTLTAWGRPAGKLLAAEKN